MGRIRITNRSDETIIIEPGDTVDLRGEEHTTRTMSARVNNMDVNSHEDKS